MTGIEVKDVDVSFPVFDTSYRSLRRNIIEVGSAGYIGKARKDRTVIEALRDVSLSIGDGDRLGLIGRNGAGKSTLLKVLAGVCPPSRGSVTIDGSVSTLFNVSGFMDPDLSGYDNIVFTGLLLGLSKKEIENLVPDIEEFTELGAYLQMPVRTYSAGMMVRLGFAVATSVTPDILLLDEAIGAGDAHFVAKAQARAKSLYEKSRVLVIASHSEEILLELCNRAVVMERGKIIADGPVAEMQRFYMDRTE